MKADEIMQETSPAQIMIQTGFNREKCVWKPNRGNPRCCFLYGPSWAHRCVPCGVTLSSPGSLAEGRAPHSREANSLCSLPVTLKAQGLREQFSFSLVVRLRPEAPSTQTSLHPPWRKLVCGRRQWSQHRQREAEGKSGEREGKQVSPGDSQALIQLALRPAEP